MLGLLDVPTPLLISAFCETAYFAPWGFFLIAYRRHGLLLL